MTAYYNEIDPYAAQWLRNLIAAGHIAPGDVDERSIALVQPDDIKNYTQCHFFAGIGVWSYALRRAGWPDERPVWTGSCPCQPFSAAGKQEGTADARHLWPQWFRLIREHRPHVIFGEQVSAAIRHAWLDLVSADLEGAGYAIGSAVMGAHSVGAPHIRQRLFFVAESDRREFDGLSSSERRERNGTASGWNQGNGESQRSGEAGELADSDGRNPGAEGLQRSGEHGLEPQDGISDRLEHTPSDGRQQRRPESSGRGATGGCGEGVMADLHGSRRGAGRSGEAGDGRGQARVEPSGLRAAHSVALGDTDNPRSQGRGVSGTDCSGNGGSEQPTRASGATDGVADANVVRHSGAVQAPPGEEGRRATEHGLRGATNGFWHNADWLPCIDGKARPVEPGTFPLAHGAPARVGRLRAYGNAINAEAAVEFIQAYDLR